MNKILKKRWVAAFLFLLALPVMANNLTISNATLDSVNTTLGFAVVKFDVTWDNSFRTKGLSPDNWDAAWTFVKYRKLNSSDAWKPCKLAAKTNHVITSGFEAVQPLDSLGVFIQRADSGAGTSTLTGVKLRWDISKLNIDPTNPIEIQVFGLEMVYVPQGAFKLGSGGTETGSFTAGPWTSGATTPYSITSEASIAIGNTTGNLWGISSTGTSTIGPAGTLPAEYPKGFSAFYCMKYEITQKGYVDFLNTLSRSQQAGRVTSATTGTGNGGYVYPVCNSGSATSRNGIYLPSVYPVESTPLTFYCNLNGSTTYNEADDGLHLACGYLNQGDVYAYLCWAGLRPMSELEFEKACRGNVTPVPNEYAWGNTTLVPVTTIANPRTDTETAGTKGQSCVLGGYSIAGPLRSGFAATATTNRLSSGASFWGIMELSGNVYETTVSVGTLNSRFFNATNGTGVLLSNGTTAITWPTDARALRGNAFNNASTTQLCVSDRANGTNNAQTERWADAGGRGVRTAP